MHTKEHASNWRMWGFKNKVVFMQIKGHASYRRMWVKAHGFIYAAHQVLQLFDIFISRKSSL